MCVSITAQVGLIERYVDTMKTAETAAANGEGGGDSSNADDINKLSSLMLDMGITSPVTRENAGGAYYQQLARQLAEFLGDYMPRNGGIMTLSDIYCMFNRARGVELVSPDDVYYAVMLQKKLMLGYHVRKFDGGLIVLQSGKLGNAFVGVANSESRPLAHVVLSMPRCVSCDRFPPRRPGCRSFAWYGHEIQHRIHH